MYSIRYGTVDDVSNIEQIIERAWLKSNISIDEKQNILQSLIKLYPKDQIIFEIQNQVQFYLLLMEEDMPMAFVSYSISDTCPADFRIHKVYSLPESQGKGYEKILIAKVEEIAIEHGGDLLFIYLKGRNKKTEYFEALGFSPWNKKKTSDESVRDENIMYKKLDYSDSST